MSRKAGTTQPGKGLGNVADLQNHGWSGKGEHILTVLTSSLEKKGKLSPMVMPENLILSSKCTAFFLSRIKRPSGEVSGSHTQSH